MDDIKAVNVDNMKTLEHYATSLVTAIISIGTMEKFHLNAYKQGLLEEDEAERALTICWELRRLMSLYTVQFEDVAERTEIDRVTVLAGLKDLIAPKKKRTRNKQPTDE